MSRDYRAAPPIAATPHLSVVDPERAISPRRPRGPTPTDRANLEDALLLSIDSTYSLPDADLDCDTFDLAAEEASAAALAEADTEATFMDPSPDARWATRRKPADRRMQADRRTRADRRGEAQRRASCLALG